MQNLNLEVLSVLAVDDNRHMHSIVKAILNSMRIKQIRFCDNAADAFVEMKQGMPDIVITDWKMEPLDGLDFVRLIRNGEDSPNPYMPIIMLTGYTEIERVTEARDCGVTEFLAKPISVEALYSRIVGIIHKPRSFIKTESYFGPDRRRVRKGEKYDGPLRRKDDVVAGSDDEAGLSQDQIDRLMF